MRTLRLGLAALVVCAGVVGLAGCQEDNNKTANITSLPGGGSSGPPKSQKEFMEQQKAKLGPSGSYGGSGYPGSEKVKPQ
jgi:hypothetical protein